MCACAKAQDHPLFGRWGALADVSIGVNIKIACASQGTGD
jgi:hypothetical protein